MEKHFNFKIENKEDLMFGKIPFSSSKILLINKIFFHKGFENLSSLTLNLNNKRISLANYFSPVHFRSNEVSIDRQFLIGGKEIELKSIFPFEVAIHYSFIN